MGHSVTGLITPKTFASQIAKLLPFDFYFELQQGFVIFPLTDDLIDEKIPEPKDFCFKEFTYLSRELDYLLKSTSTIAHIAYIETNYFGGQGYQSAIVYFKNSVIYGPQKSENGVINEALKILGVSILNNKIDEFDSIGLGEFRSSESLFENHDKY